MKTKFEQRLLNTFKVVAIIVLITLLCLIFFPEKNKIYQFPGRDFKKTDNSKTRIDTISQTVKITVYNPTIGQCDSSYLYTADGSYIDTAAPQRWIAISRNLEKNFPLGTMVYLSSKRCPIVNGQWEIHDRLNKRFKDRIDILISNTNEVIFGGLWDGLIYKMDTIK